MTSITPRLVGVVQHAVAGLGGDQEDGQALPAGRPGCRRRSTVEAVHARHDHVQQHGAEALGVAQDGLQALHAVLGLFDVVVAGAKMFSNMPRLISSSSTMSRLPGAETSPGESMSIERSPSGLRWFKNHRSPARSVARKGRKAVYSSAARRTRMRARMPGSSEEESSSTPPAPLCASASARESVARRSSITGSTPVEYRHARE